MHTARDNQQKSLSTSINFTTTMTIDDDDDVQVTTTQPTPSSFNVLSVVACTVCWCTFAADRPLIVQFAANSAKDFADATEIVAP